MQISTFFELLMSRSEKRSASCIEGFACSHPLTAFGLQKLNRGFTAHSRQFIIMTGGALWSVSVLASVSSILCVCCDIPWIIIKCLYLCIFTCMCYSGDLSLSKSRKLSLFNVRSRQVAYSPLCDRQLGRALVSAQEHIYSKACHVQLQVQNGEMFSIFEYVIHGSVFQGKLV